MFSSTSALVRDAEAGAQALALAAVIVAERSFFACAEPDAAGYPLAAAGPWYEASVRFAGPLTGCMTLSLPVVLARELCAAFLGLEPDAPLDASAVADLAGEFANMTCGTWLTGLGASTCFTIERPNVRPVSASPRAQATVLVNERPTAVHVAFDGVEP